MTNLANIFAALQIHKQEEQCFVHHPETVETPPTFKHQLGLSDSQQQTHPEGPFRCFKSTSRRVRTDSESGTAFLNVFSLFVFLPPNYQDITATCLIELETQRYPIHQLDHDPTGRYWKVELKDAKRLQHKY